MSRPSWDAYFLDLARAASARSTCDKAHVGCVLVKDRQVISTGYNGSVSGTPHCDDEGIGHLLNSEGACVRSVHSEEGALVLAAKRGIQVDGADCFITHAPCWRCFRMLVQAGVPRIVFTEWKKNKLTPDIFYEMIKILEIKKIELTDAEGRKFQDIVKVVEGKVLPE